MATPTITAADPAQERPEPDPRARAAAEARALLRAAEPAAVAEPAARPDHTAGRGRSRLVAAGLAVVAAGLAVALTLTSMALARQEAQASARRTVLAVARADAVALTTYSYLHLQQDFAKVLAQATPSFRATYTASSGGLDKILTSYKASAQGNVVAAAVASVSGRTATVLLFVNQKTHNSLRKGAATEDSRLQITLLRRGGRWLINRVRLL